MVDHPARTLLARAPGIAVEACTCGALHVTIGALTLRLDPSAFTRLCATLADAELTRALTRTSPTPRPGLPA
jgi:hypothetical protein